jgi:hypothetical protein
VIYTDIYAAAPLLLARGLDREAERWLDYEMIGVARPLYGIVTALLRGQLAERLGQRAKAAAAYRLVARSWAHGDPQFGPYVAAAKAGLQRIGAGPVW